MQTLRRLRCAIMLIAAIAGTAGAQTRLLLARADSLLGAGEVSRAESLYYIASRRDPQDATARTALGRYLGSRGAFRIAATLLDEAATFGGDTLAVARMRAPLLQAADDWTSLAQQKRSPLTPAERARAEWLATHPPAVKGADSVTVVFELSSAAGLGRVRMVIGTDTLATDIDPNSDELVIGDYAPFAAMVRVFSAATGDRVGVVEHAAIGDLVFERLPARFDPSLGVSRARIGLSLLARLAPTIDAGAGVVTLRRDGRVGASLGRRRVPLFFAFPGVRVARAGRLVPIESAAGRAVLAEARWTVDLKRGELVLEVDK